MVIVDLKLRSAEKLAGIDIASQSTGWNAAQIVNTICVWAVKHARTASVPRKWKTAWRRRTVSSSLILGNCVSNQSTRGRAGCRADGGAANASSSSCTDDRAGRRAITGALAFRRVA